MRAILNEDMVVKITSDPMLGVEVGNVPPGVGLERLRYVLDVGLVDIAMLKALYVRHKNGFFEFHAIGVPGSQRVTMTYADRHKLMINPNGTIRLMTEQELIEKEKRRRLAKLENGYSSKIKQEIGRPEEQTRLLFILIDLITRYLFNADATAEEILRTFMDSFSEVDVKDAAAKIKGIAEWYENEKEQIGATKSIHEI